MKSSKPSEIEDKLNRIQWECQAATENLPQRSFNTSVMQAVPKITDTRGLGFHLLHLKGDTNFTEVLEGKEEKTESVMTMMTLLGKKIIFKIECQVQSPCLIYLPRMHIFTMCVHTHITCIYALHGHGHITRINKHCMYTYNHYMHN